MNKQEALARLAALETETAALRKIIEAPEVAGSLLTKPVPGSGERYWCIETQIHEVFAKCLRSANSKNDDIYSHGNFFQSEEIAAAYADAIDCLLLLRHQPGTVAASDEDVQYTIETASSGNVVIEDWTGDQYKLRCISPCFATVTDAQRAINTIGADRILRMFKTLHGIYD